MPRSKPNEKSNAAFPTPSIPHLRDARQHQALNLEGGRQVTKLLKCSYERIELGPRRCARPLKEVSFMEEIIGFLDVFLFDAADIDHHIDSFGPVLGVVKPLN